MGKQYIAPTHVFDGERVIAPYPPKPGVGVRCVVACAAGYYARVVNEKRGIDRWYHIRDLRKDVEASDD